MPLGFRDRFLDGQDASRRSSSKRRVPLACEPLDTRQLLSTMSIGGALSVRDVKLPAAEVAQSDASEAQFSMSPSRTIESGQPVAEQLATVYFDGSTQTETILKVPDSASNSVTSYKTINLRHNGGIETVVDTETFSGGTTSFSGIDNTHAITTTLPNGQVQTETDTDMIVGHKTYINSTIHEAGGGVETVSSIQTQHGRTTMTTRTITEPDGVVENQKSMSTGVGALDSTSRTTTTLPGEVSISSSATNVTRVQPPTTS